MTPARIGCIVEGHGELRSVPTLVHRIARIEAPNLILVAETMLRVNRGRLVKREGIESAIKLVAQKLQGAGAILVVLDADDDCPAKLGPQMQQWSAGARPDLPVGLALANREFEAWFLASAESLAGKRNLPLTLVSHPQPDTVRGAKGWLSAQMPRSRSYSASVDQYELTRLFDIEQARARSDSFDKCYREITKLLHALQ